MSLFIKSRALRTLGAIAVVVAIPAFSLANHSWAGYHWARTSNPLKLKLGDNITTAWDPYLATASADWMVSTVLDTTIVPGLVNTVKKCSPTLGRVEVCNTTYGKNGWLGIAQVWVNGTHITQGTVKLNDSYFSTAAYNKPAWKRLVMCQEVAHTFGLDHQDEAFANTNLGTCMDYTNDPDGTIANPDQLSNEHPNQHDFDELQTIYAHLDATVTATSTSTTAKMPPTLSGDREVWGKMIHSRNGGRTEEYEYNFGGGQKLLTMVIWAK